ncbi:myosin-2-like [Impatiens glandulifera]|uniref:myosin-2-like n=1 Tax=Impatiens glandulifera TaxID=253017 RepID=UPI001FB19EF4|nr:myosin-2-like [Impatiens glandulifera]
MMLSVTKSSLEEMLDALQRRGDDEKPKDLPPSLPSRPSSKARRPSSRLHLPKILDVNKLNHSTTTAAVIESNRQRIGSFGGKNDRELFDESPYVKEIDDKTEQRNHSSSPASFQESEWNDKIGYFIKKKLHVWCRVPNGRWELGKIVSTSGEKATILLSDGIVTAEVLTGDILPANPDILDGVDNLIQLSYLNEPSVLHNLQCRYSKDIIYSKAGSVLIAINPFKDVNCNENDFITAYREKFIDNPHVYAVADTAYNEMMRDGTNQSIIISGESGSGKTETAKVAMQYLAAVGGGNSRIESEILSTSCILEAFGNAKTARNNNSSRFGKLIEIHFGVTGEICGAQIQTFLLEKSRVVQLAHEERSYHIFYQLCAGASSDLKAQFNLKTASEYNYLNQSQCLNIDGIDDAQNFKILVEALDTVRISKEDQSNVLQMIASVLWLGNISFKVTDNVNYVEVVSDEALTVSARLLGCSTEDLMSALSTRRIQAGKDIFAKNLTMQQAIDSRDALSKFIYVSLFDRLVEGINESLKLRKEYAGTSSISIVDIYGFETLKKNSFEQLCINYANERLQQHFTRHLFKLEQEEYESEGIDWTKVDFKDNQECLDLFEKKPTGLLSLLDEESKFPKANDLTFANKLKQHLNNNNHHFKGETGGSFVIRHYAGEVLYDTSGFLEKNRDQMQSDILQLLSSCGNRLLRLFAFDQEKPSVGTEFKNQLFKLVQKLESTTPHFILCIKPNNKQLSGMYEKDLVLEQLRSGGVLSVVRISRNRYPTRVTHQEFARRYAVLLRPEDDSNNAGEDPLCISMAVLQQFDIMPDMYQVGYTKLYFRTGQISALEETKKQVLQGNLKTQNQFRDHQVVHHFSELKNGVITLQSFIRGENARKTLQDKISAVILLQSVIRGWLNKQKNRRKTPEIKEETLELIHVQPSVLEELKKRVSEAEATISQKEKENEELKKDLRQSESKRLDYEARMKMMEETWQNKFATLQQQTNQVRRDYSPSPYDSEDALSMGPSTPLQSTPTRILNTSGREPSEREPNGGMNLISHLEMEFDQRKRNFDDEVKEIGNSVLSLRPGDELRKLKMRFEMWKKDYKTRLREARAKLRSNGERSRRKWWGMRNK